MATRTHRTDYDISATDHASPAFRSVQRSMEQAQAAGAKLRQALGSIGVGFSVGAFATAIVDETRKAEQASNRLVAVLRATGHQAGITKNELDAMAESAQDAFGFDDESVRDAQSALLKFGNIQGDVFREGLKLSADLAAFMGTNIPEAAQMIGKSLQSPTEGLTMMERQFGKLTDAEEKNIKTLVSQGSAIEAQTAVLELWRSKIGGTAELMNTGLTKATRDVANAWGDMLESLGRTESVGGTVRDILGGIRDILNDIKSLSDGEDPMKRMLLNLESMNEELARLEETSGKSTAAQRSGFGQAASEAARAQIEARIGELKTQRESLLSAIRALQSAGDPSNMDVRDIRLRMPGPVTLGGKTEDEEAKRRLARAEELARKFAEIQAKSAPPPMDASFEEMSKFWTELAIDAKGTVEEIKKAEEALRRFLELQAKSAPPPMDAEFEDLEKFWARQAVMVEKVTDLSRDLGFTFASAFEDAIVKGEDLRAVVQGLAQDIMRITVRRTVTEPLAGAISSGISGMFVGGGDIGAFASGGRPPVGQISLVGERGPELFVPDQAGTVLPNDTFGGVTVNQHFNFSANTPAAARDAVFAAAPTLIEASKNAVFDAMRRGNRP